MKSDYKGIDYGLGQSNVDKDTGIRYGVISQHEVLQAWADSSEPNYGPTCCPKCGNAAKEFDDPEFDCPHDEQCEDTDSCMESSIEAYEHYHHSCDDYRCDDCKLVFDLSSFDCEPLGYTLDDGEYLAVGDNGDIFILKSPYYTHCQFCSPCAPGAGYIMNTVDDGPKTYCFGHDWFDDNIAPYPVYRVSDDTLVTPE